MKPIGGEIAHKKSTYQSYLTDSGRSSLRLFFRSNDYRNKKVLLPDFYCGIIEQILQEEQVTYAFYKVNPDFSINHEEINQCEFDIFYVINYFGYTCSLKKINLSDKILIEDNVFLLDFKNHHNAKKWFAFNSYRKITTLTDGSLIKTNLSINASLIKSTQADFVKYKEAACNTKYTFLNKDKHSEQKYLDAFKKGEEYIDFQNKIYTISAKSLYLLQNIKTEKIVKKRFKKLQKIIAFNKNKPNHYSFFIFKNKAKANFIIEMRKHHIYLPYFWHKTTKENILYDELIAIPLFSNYSDTEFKFLYNILMKYLC